MLDDIMIFYANMLKEYCDDRSCAGCPFANTFNGRLVCNIELPAYWDLKEVKNDKS